MVASDSLAKRMYDLGYIQRSTTTRSRPPSSISTRSPRRAAIQPRVLDPLAGRDDRADRQQERCARHHLGQRPLRPPSTKARSRSSPSCARSCPLVMKAEGIDPATATSRTGSTRSTKLKQAARRRPDPSLHRRRLRARPRHRRRRRGGRLGGRRLPAPGRQPDLNWVMPTEGCILWWDNWVIPVGAPNPTAAYDWINYTYEPEHQAQIDAWTGAVTPVTGVQPVLQRTAPTWPTASSSSRASSTRTTARRPYRRREPTPTRPTFRGPGPR